MGKKFSELRLHEKIGSAAVIVCFLGAIISMVYFSRTGNPAAAVFVFGALFTLFGIVFLYKAGGINTNSIGLLFIVLAGLGALVCSAIQMWGGSFGLELSKQTIPVLICALFILVGAGMAVLSPIITRQKKVKYSEQVNAQCVGLDEKYSGNTTNGVNTIICAPIFRYFYRGKEYEVTSNVYSNVNVPKKGEDYDICINPQDPEDYYRPSKKQDVLIIIIGILIAAAGAFALYMFINNGQ